MTADEKVQLISDLIVIVHAQQPMTVRQVFYRATVKGLVEKTEAGYSKIQRLLVEMRRSGLLPFQWIADNSRSVYRIETFDSPQDAVEMTAQFYRKSLWSQQPVHVEVWLEKDALTGVVRPVTSEYDIGLYVARGFASLSFLHTSAEMISEIGKPTYIYHLGDHDPSGLMAGEKIESTLRELAPEAEIHFERIAVTPLQIQAWSLPSRPTKKSTHTAQWSGGNSVELDAIEPDQLRALVRDAIELHLPRDEFSTLKVAEESERQLLTAWAEGGAS
ncbi:MAG: hypothetical protein GY807_13740 [Gammaproteobacteria bacterium]|nr:hypothetical protein [Gammaproteobacteria bacterium]